MTDINARIEELARSMFYAGLSKPQRIGLLGETTWENVTEWERIRHRIMARYAFIEIMSRDAVAVAMSVGRPVGAGDGDTYIPGSSGDVARALEAAAKDASNG